MDNILEDEINFTIKHKPLKRIFDIIFSFAAIIFGLPLFLAIALAVKLSSNGPIFYRHERIGRGGKPFFCYKFRTMHVNADVVLNEILLKNPTLKQEWETTRKLKKDPRVSSVGNFLRRTSLDELPQFWNVLRGDLSVVGPRAVVKAEVIQYLGAKSAKILSIRPGITGIWQVSGRNDLSYLYRIHLDEKYVDNHSLLLDLKLILKTIPTMISQKGAY